MLKRETILIVDDHPVVQDGLRLLLGELLSQSECTAVDSREKAAALIDSHFDFDWILIDVNLPDGDGIELIKNLASKKITAFVIVLSSDSGPAVVDRALSHGANGFLSKSFNRSELARCLNAIRQGGIYIDAGLRRELNSYRQSILAEKTHIEANLTMRQRQTLIYLAQGYSNREIADCFDITESTVKSHVQALMALFEADNRTHCVSEASRLSII